MQTTNELLAIWLLNVSNLDIIWFILKKPELFFSLTLNKLFINLFGRKSFFHLFVVVVFYTFLQE